MCPSPEPDQKTASFASSTTSLFWVASWDPLHCPGWKAEHRIRFGKVIFLVVMLVILFNCLILYRFNICKTSEPSFFGVGKLKRMDNVRVHPGPIVPCLAVWLPPHLSQLFFLFYYFILHNQYTSLYLFSQWHKHIYRYSDTKGKVFKEKLLTDFISTLGY